MNYQAIIDQIKRHEGLRLKPYKCTEGFITIGYGRNLETNGISAQEAEEMLLSDLSNVEKKLDTAHAFKNLNEARKAVLLNMCYQLGFAGLLKFKRMLYAIERQDYADAAKEMLDSRWAKQTPSRAKELSEQMATGEFQ